MLRQLERIPWPVWVIVTIGILWCGWCEWSHYCGDPHDQSWLDPHQAPCGIVVPPVTLIGMGGGGTSHGSGHPSPVMQTRSYPPTLAEWEGSMIRNNFQTPGVV